MPSNSVTNYTYDNGQRINFPLIALKKKKKT